MKEKAIHNIGIRLTNEELKIVETKKKEMEQQTEKKITNRKAIKTILKEHYTSTTINKNEPISENDKEAIKILSKVISLIRSTK